MYTGEAAVPSSDAPRPASAAAAGATSGEAGFAEPPNPPEPAAAWDASAPAPFCSVRSSADSFRRSTLTSAFRYSARFDSVAATSPASYRETTASGAVRLRSRRCCACAISVSYTHLTLPTTPYV